MTVVRTRPLVLVVDDDFAMRLLATEALAGAEIDTVEASDGAAALERYEETRPDAILLDVVMEGMDGYETCRSVRALGDASTPILMMTARDDVGAIDAAYHAGATDFIPKPIPYSLLAHRVRYLLRAADAFRQEREATERLSRAQRLARLAQWDLNLESGGFRWSTEALDVFGIQTTGETGSVERMLAFIHPEDRERVERALASGQSHQLDYRMVLSDGRERLIHHEAERWDDPQRNERRLVGASQDVTERRQAERRATQLTYYDGLTGLPNRTQLRNALARALAATEIDDTELSLLVVDVDHLKRVNDLLGHAAGDAVLIETSRRLLDATADLQPHEVTVARLDGDAFAVLVTNTGETSAVALAGRIGSAMEAPLAFDDEEINLSVSVGIACSPDSGRSAAELFKNADAALAHAKRVTPGSAQVFADELRAKMERRMLIEIGLTAALEIGSGTESVPAELELHFQPKVTLPSMRAHGAEALVRWRSPRLGNVSPAEFVAVAEETDLMVPLGAWVLRTACETAVRELSDTTVAVNISPKQFVSSGFVDFVARTIDETGIAPARLELEITEGVVMQDTARSQQVLSALKGLGVRIVLDDFGTGYSSLGYLLRFPIDGLKIDRSFVKDLPCPRCESLIHAIVAMASNLGIDVVAEGIETVEQLQFFHGLGAIDIQGYYFSKPLPAPSLRTWLDARTAQQEGSTRARADAASSCLTTV